MSKKESSDGLKWKLIVIPIVLSAIATLIVAIIAPIVVEYFKTPELKLEYYVQDTIPFKTQTQETASYQVMIENAGTKSLEDIVCQILFPNAQINQSAFFSNTLLHHNETISGGSLTVSISDMNPQETATIYALATSTQQLPNQPDIQIRAKGVSGVQGSIDNEGESIPWYLTLATTITLFATGIGSARVLFKRESKMKSEKSFEQDQNESLGYLCGIHGLDSEMERYYNTSTKTYYRKEADRLANKAIKNPADSAKIQRVLIDLLKYPENIASASMAIIHFNIAKIAKFNGNADVAKEHIEEATKLCPILVEKRLKIDPVFKN